MGSSRPLTSERLETSFESGDSRQQSGLGPRAQREAKAERMLGGGPHEAKLSGGGAAPAPQQPDGYGCYSAVCLLRATSKASQPANSHASRLVWGSEPNLRLRDQLVIGGGELRETAHERCQLTGLRLRMSIRMQPGGQASKRPLDRVAVDGLGQSEQ